MIEHRLPRRNPERLAAIADSAAEHLPASCNQLAPRQTHLAGVGWLDPGGHAQQRRAAGTTLAPHHDHLACLDHQRDVVQRDTRTVTVALAYVVELEDRHDPGDLMALSSNRSRATRSQDIIPP